MKAIFISYRRRDTQDVAGRIFDRLSGYFGPGMVLLDVDALVAGGNYRTQIEQLLKRCSVVLAVIGKEWLTTTDDAGRRRLDNPDDQLRIEIAVALAGGKQVIPILVHDATMPAAADLPAELAGLAACEPHYVQSGTSFNSDVQYLVERLEDGGLRAPESRFPWHTALLTAGILVSFSAILGLTLMTPENINDYELQQVDPKKPLSELRAMSGDAGWDGKPFDLVRYDRRLSLEGLFVYLPMVVGPMLIVWGKRKCCLNKERNSARRYYSQGAGRLPMPKSGKSILCLALGVASLGGGVLTAIPAAIVGALAWIELRRHPTWMRGRSLVVFGLLAASAGAAMSWFTHGDSWRRRTWIAAMERAAEVQEDGDSKATLAALDGALAASHGDFRKASVVELKRGELFMGDSRLQDAEKSLTAAIETIEAEVPETGSPVAECEDLVWRTARTQRAQVREELGKAEEAEVDYQYANWGLYNRAGAIQQSVDGQEAPPARPPPADEAAPSDDDEAPAAPPAPPEGDPAASRGPAPRRGGESRLARRIYDTHFLA